MLTDRARRNRQSRLFYWRVSGTEKCPSKSEWDKWRKSVEAETQIMEQRSVTVLGVKTPVVNTSAQGLPGPGELGHVPVPTGTPGTPGGIPIGFSLGHGFSNFNQSASAALGTASAPMEHVGLRTTQPQTLGLGIVNPTAQAINTPDAMGILQQLLTLNQQTQATIQKQQQELAYLRAKVDGQNEQMEVEEEPQSKESSTFNLLVDSMIEALDLPDECRSSQYVPSLLTCENDRPRNIPPKLPLHEGMLDCIKAVYRMPTRYSTPSNVIPHVSTFGRYRLLKADMGKVGAFRSLDPDISIHCKHGLNEDSIKLDQEEFNYDSPKLIGPTAHVANLSKSGIQSAGAMIHMNNYVRHGINWQLASVKHMRDLVDQLPSDSPITKQLGSVADCLEGSITLQSQCNIDLTQQAARNLAVGVQQIRKIGLDQTSWKPHTHKPLLELPVPTVGKSDDNPIALLFGAPLLEKMADLQSTQVRSVSVNRVLGTTPQFQKRTYNQSPLQNMEPTPPKQPKFVPQAQNLSKGELKRRLAALNKAERQQKPKANKPPGKGRGKGKGQVSHKPGTDSTQ
jgi:hypothetical protein